MSPKYNGIELSQLDSELFEQSEQFDNVPQSDNFFSEMADVKPIEQDKIIKQSKTDQSINHNYRQKVASSFSVKDKNFLTDGEVETVEPEEVLNFKIDGIQPLVFKKLRQGKYEIDYHIDLHRMTVAEARKEVYSLLVSAVKFGYRNLLITHGKGIKSPIPARLKSYVYHWLKQVDNVVAFHSAQTKHGGTGSVYVLLKKTPQQRLNQAKYR
jgi:DNA-nicking Smr family endonuclease